MSIWRRAACWISKATYAQAHARKHAHALTRARSHAHRQIRNTYWLFHGNNSFVKAPECQVIRTSPVLLGVGAAIKTSDCNKNAVRACEGLSIMPTSCPGALRRAVTGVHWTGRWTLQSRQKFLPAPRIKPQFVCRPARSPVSVLTTRKGQPVHRYTPLCSECDVSAAYSIRVRSSLRPIRASDSPILRTIVLVPGLSLVQ